MPTGRYAIPLAALAALALAPGAAAARLPLVAPAGGQLEATVRLAGPTGKAGLVLSRKAKSAKRGIVLRGKAKRARGRVRIRATVPASIPLGRKLTLFACADARKAKGCRALGKLPTSGPALQQRLDAAVAAHRLGKGQALLYGLYAMNADPRLPLELRAKSAGAAGSEGLIRDAMLAGGSLPRAVQRRLIWYFVPPAGKGSAWRGVAARGRASSLASAASRSRGASCQGYESLADSPYSGAGRAAWVGVPTSDGHAIVWYQEDEPRAQAAARAYARYMPEIWRKLTREFQAPKSDAGERCFHGPDGRFDIYVNGTVTWLAAGGLGSGSANATRGITMPYPLAHSSWCTNRPAWIAIHPGESRFVLAHEFMHAIEFSYRYATCENVSWWDEGVANWAGDFVYPRDNDEQQRWPDWVKDPLAQGSIADDDYQAFPLWTMLQRTLGTGVLRQIFAKLGSAGSVQAVNAAIPGGYAKQWPRFAAHVYNQPPVGTLGFELSQSFKAWDDWGLTPQVPGPVTLELSAGGGERTLLLAGQNPTPERLTIDAYHRVEVPDARVKEIRFKNGVGSNGVLAMLKLADGSWKLKDWSGKAEVTLCREKPEEDVRELIIVTANTSMSGRLGTFHHELRARPKCKVPKYSGTFTATGSYGPEDIGGTATATWSGSVTFTPATEQELTFYPGVIPYRITAGHVNYEMHGHFDDDCDASASKSFNLPTQDTSYLGSLQLYPAVPQDKYVLLVGMPLTQTTTATLTNCADPSSNRDIQWILAIGVPALLANGDLGTHTAPTGAPYSGPPLGTVGTTGAIAGTGSGGNTSNDPVAVTWHWDLGSQP